VKPARLVRKVLKAIRETPGQQARRAPQGRKAWVLLARLALRGLRAPTPLFPVLLGRLARKVRLARRDRKVTQALLARLAAQARKVRLARPARFRGQQGTRDHKAKLARKARLDLKAQKARREHRGRLG
jgi:hypothetical protein